MTNPDSNQADWSNYWQGRAAGKTGEVFAGVGVETSDELHQHWRDVFANCADGTVLDLACGAGSVIRHAAAAGLADLIGLDFSPAAIAATRQSCPDLLGLVASADVLPLADASVSMVASQFGFEYADRKRAAREVHRVLKPGGRFSAIVHLKNGAIDRECRGHLARLEAITQSAFLPAARTVFSTVFAFERDPSGAHRAAMDAALGALAAAQEALAPEVRAGGLAAHLQAGAGQLFERRRSYLESDILKWLDDMEGEMVAYRGRMNGMLGAAIDRDEGESLLKAIAPDGKIECHEFHLAGRAAAWRMSAAPRS